MLASLTPGGCFEPSPQRPKILILKQHTSSRTHYAKMFSSAAFPILLETGFPDTNELLRLCLSPDTN